MIRSAQEYAAYVVEDDDVRLNAGRATFGASSKARRRRDRSLGGVLMSPQSPSGSARGRYAKKRNGRVKKQAEAIRQLAQEGRKLSQIAKEVEIARASVRRVIARQSAQEGMAR